MATTTNYSWTTPDDTDLVKDGASAIRSLGTAIDSTVFTNAGNAVQKSTIDAKGDLLVGTADNTIGRLAVGTNNYVLTADSAEASGVKWAAASGGLSAFTTFTPTFSNLTVGNGTVYGAYATLGDMVYLEYRIKWGSTTSASGNWRLNNLPINGQVTSSQALEGDTDTFQAICGNGGAYDASASYYYELALSLNTTSIMNASPVFEPAPPNYSTFASNMSISIPFTWTTNDVFVARAWYRKA